MRDLRQHATITGGLLLFFLAFFNLQCRKTAKDAQQTTTEADHSAVSLYLTRADQAAKLERQEAALSVPFDTPDHVIRIDPETKFQEIDGFGFALTGGSAFHLHGMSPAARNALLLELFGREEGQLAMSYIRISIGASDLDAEPFSYSDLPPGHTDPELSQFSIEPDRLHLIPMLKEILVINPDIKIMASPWSPPTWMKSNGSTKGGSLLPEFYDAYALYFVRYLQAMAAEGIPIEAITIQNEPLHPGNNPSLKMTAPEQTAFIKQSLGPAFAANDIDTRIIVYDHNADKPEYPLAVLGDPEANAYVDGAAFHLYGGEIENIASVHAAHPDKNLYFTEQWYGASGTFADDFLWHTREVVIGSIRNWSKCVIEWNLSSNPELQPHTEGGCSQCLGAITIDGDQVDRNAGYYVVGHASRFVPPGSHRIASNEELPNVAFVTPDQQIVLLVTNDADAPKRVNISQGELQFSVTLAAKAVGTLVWDNH